MEYKTAALGQNSSRAGSRGYVVVISTTAGAKIKAIE